jgi:hypothetical protein
MGMHPTTMTRADESSSRELVGAAHPGTRRVSADLAIGLTLLGVAILGKLLWVVTDGGVLAVVGAR